MISTISCCAFGQDSKLDMLVQQGLRFHDKGQYDIAIDKYKKALAIDPSSSLANSKISASYLSAEDYEHALEYSKKVLKAKDENLLEGYITYGSALDKLGKTNKAIKVYAKAMKQFDNYLLYYNHAFACFETGNITKSYDSVIKAINNNPSYASSHLLLSQIEEQRGSCAKTMLSLYYFLLLEPNSERAVATYDKLEEHINRGVSTGDDTDFCEAEKLIRLSKRSYSTKQQSGETDMQLFVADNERVLKIFADTKGDNTGFWWDFYVSFFAEMTEKGMTETFSYYISYAQGDVVTEWIKTHDSDFYKFDTWFRNY